MTDITREAVENLALHLRSLASASIHRTEVAGLRDGATALEALRNALDEAERSRDQYKHDAHALLQVNKQALGGLDKLAATEAERDAAIARAEAAEKDRDIAKARAEAVAVRLEMRAEWIYGQGDGTGAAILDACAAGLRGGPWPPQESIDAARAALAKEGDSHG